MDIGNWQAISAGFYRGLLQTLEVIVEPALQQKPN